MTTVLAFAFALGLLIAIHEYGHYRVALACGIKVLRFSIGFGRPLISWRLAGKPTEFVICIVPLGGYVRMLDEREGPVDPSERHQAFNTQPLRSRAAVVAAGPLANLLLAVLLYAAVSWMGVEEPRAILATPPAGSLAEAAGLRAGELVLETAIEGEAPRPVRAFDDLRWQLARAALEGQALTLTLQAEADRGGAREVLLDLRGLEQSQVDAAFFRRVGLAGVYSRPVIGAVQDGGAAEQAGLRPGDLVLRVDGRGLRDAAQLRDLIRRAEPGQVQIWQLERAGRSVELQVRPQVREEGGLRLGRIGAFVGEPPQTVLVREDLPGALWEGWSRTWEISVLTLRMLGKMVIGEASLKNLSGPLTIADYAGKSASQGLTAYLLFLAMISVSLGVLNLLPLPILDGGHLMYYLWEFVTGRSPSEAAMERLQRLGVGLLVALMCVALFNDIVRLLV
jgi:regulator of sigma E protease